MAQVVGFISGRMETKSSFLLAAVPRNDRLTTSTMPRVAGRSINSGKSRRINNGTHTRF
jgi:hypothetical protein